MTDRTSGIRGEYERDGADGFYAAKGAEYRNPHEARVRAALRAALAAVGPRLDLRRVLDLCCGSGEVTLFLRDEGGPAVGTVEGLDPFTHAAYEERTGDAALRLSFLDLAQGELNAAREPYTLVVCSYALHLADPSVLPMLCFFLCRMTPHLLVLTPHKRPHLKADWGFELVWEAVVERTRARLYRSTAA